METLDETGFRVGGRTEWLHVICTPHLAAYRVDARRGFLFEGVSGVAVHDRWQGYWKLRDVEHGLCNAHHLRELQALVELDKEAWAGRLQRLLRRAWRVARASRARGIAVPERLRARFERDYDRVLVEAMAFHDSLPPLSSPARCGKPRRRKGHNLALNLHRYGEETLRSIIATAQKQGRNVLKALAGSSDRFIADIQYA